jgi:isopentenyl diphosphate isomerase/L-lactate dehydrogenase-like FMN-dependent dehydrogenase
MNIDKAQSIDDLRQLAKRRLPKILFELIESGVESEEALSRNRDAFKDYTFVARYLGDIAERKQSVEVFGRHYASPFGIGPTGFAGLMRKGLDESLAEAAAAADIPFVLSGASIASIETISRIAPRNTWAHLYPAKDVAITGRILERYAAADVETLVVTVDNPVFPKRERDNRNGFILPLKMPLPIMLEALLHPGWMLEYFGNGGMPMMGSWRDYAPAGSTAEQVATFFRSQSPSTQTWASIAAMRRIWPGKFVLKGVQHPDDATRAIDEGIDGLIVSNHGGKSFDPLPSPLVTLPGVRAAVAGRIPVMFDSGIRRGAEILVAKALGADFVFVARATLYGAVAGGRAGADRAIGILRSEIDMSLAMTGVNDIADLASSHLIQKGRTA